MRDVALLRSLHERLINQMGLRRINTARIADVELRDKTRIILTALVDEDLALRDREVQDRLIEAALDVVGLGLLEALLEDDSVTEIMVNCANVIFVECSGRLELFSIVFSSDEAVRPVIDRIVAPLGRCHGSAIWSQTVVGVMAPLPDRSCSAEVVSKLAAHRDALRYMSSIMRAVRDIDGSGSLFGHVE